MMIVVFELSERMEQAVIGVCKGNLKFSWVNTVYNLYFILAAVL